MSLLLPRAVSYNYDQNYVAKTKKGNDGGSNFPQPPPDDAPKGFGPYGEGCRLGGSGSGNPVTKSSRGGFGNIHPNGKF